MKSKPASARRGKSHQPTTRPPRPGADARGRKPVPPADLDPLPIDVRPDPSADDSIEAAADPLAESIARFAATFRLDPSWYAKFDPVREPGTDVEFDPELDDVEFDIDPFLESNPLLDFELQWEMMLELLGMLDQRPERFRHEVVVRDEDGWVLKIRIVAVDCGTVREYDAGILSWVDEFHRDLQNRTFEGHLH